MDVQFRAVFHTKISIITSYECFLSKRRQSVHLQQDAKNTEDGLLSAAMGSPYFLALATAEGMLYTWAEHVEKRKLVGFENSEAIKRPRDHGVIIGTKK